MDHNKYIEIGLNGMAPLKVIMRGSIENAPNGRVGVVSLVYATLDKESAKKKINELMLSSAEAYYMVYSVPLDTDLSKLEHYPSIAITREDLQLQ